MGVSQSIFKVIKSEVFRFPRLQSLSLFFCSLVPIHSVSHTYIDALCSILSNFCSHFTRPRPYSISPLALAGKQKGYDYLTFLTCCYKLQKKKSCRKFLCMCVTTSVSNSVMMAHNHLPSTPPHNLPTCLIAG